MTLRMIAFVQVLLMAANAADRETDLYGRLFRIESYLIRRFNRG
jgi:hypothetical protein